MSVGSNSLVELDRHRRPPHELVKRSAAVPMSSGNALSVCN